MNLWGLSSTHEIRRFWGKELLEKLTQLAVAVTIVERIFNGIVRPEPF